MNDRTITQTPKPRTVRCPACGGPSVFSPENRYRPFCSERCKLHDLGAWANESFRVQAQEDDGAEDRDGTRLQ
ncbi:DNA gyrase inhibitor YacG [Ottowia testudinis]|uniref:DNA gyrase inhibitor YacG n=1 Tax=Ottowia testudinis TaxID=2816950 RepID=A0A975H4A4_9BURK|nr:DNA gyrase inhibitor YacG [Ottowia testudinis]QTD46111.1 DNA gyrase inhibitor YacG [Ottowia testudinis]